METDTRSFQALKVDLVGVETGLERFTKDGITHLPPIQSWRNNLTALSNKYNLFFIATADRVAVYVPEFPYQKLRQRPALLIRPELAQPGVVGFLASRSNNVLNHCINHLIVDDLGSQEILVLVTDSGNVTAYHTSAILQAIRKTHNAGIDGSDSDTSRLRPFFMQWVRQSAWGVAIHSQARMIAVSANTPSIEQPNRDDPYSATVTVFAFALVQPEQDSEADCSSDCDDDLKTTEWTAWPGAIMTPLIPERAVNYKIVLAGAAAHEYNIPNISFLKTSDGVEDVWLLSTDIRGVMKLWQVWRGCCYRTWYFGEQENTVAPWLNRGWPGWHVAAIDVADFRPANSNDEFIGFPKAPLYMGFLDRGPSFNIGQVAARQTPGNSAFHPGYADPDDTEEPLEGDIIFSPRTEPVIDSDDDGATSDVTSPPPEIHSPLLGFSRTRLSGSLTPTAHIPSQPLEYHVAPDHAYPPMVEDSEDSGSDQSEDFHPTQRRMINGRVDRYIRQKVTPLADPDQPVPPVAIIHCSDRHVRLLSGPRSKFPHVFCANILKQLMPEDIHQTNEGIEFVHADRLNILAKIPELGVVLIATQAGRVAVCTLTRRTEDEILGFRVDWILPTKRQERERQIRPNLCTLIGMAVGPIQGRLRNDGLPVSEYDQEALCQDGKTDGVPTTFDPIMVTLRHKLRTSEWKAMRRGEHETRFEKVKWSTRVGDDSTEYEDWAGLERSRRYRVMLTYSDLTVLTYELWRDVERGDLAFNGDNSGGCRDNIV